MHDEHGIEKNVRKYLPSKRRVLLHAILMVVAAFSLGPLLGPLIFSTAAIQETWGRGQSHQIGSIANWGTLFLIVELLAYTAWLGRMGKKGYLDHRASEWHKQLEGSEPDDQMTP